MARHLPSGCVIRGKSTARCGEEAGYRRQADEASRTYGSIAVLSAHEPHDIRKSTVRNEIPASSATPLSQDGMDSWKILHMATQELPSTKVDRR